MRYGWTGCIARIPGCPAAPSSRATAAWPRSRQPPSSPRQRATRPCCNCMNSIRNTASPNTRAIPPQRTWQRCVRTACPRCIGAASARCVSYSNLGKDMALYQLIHLFAVVVWVGGMFFAYMVLRPTAVEVLPPPERLRLWDKTFRRFFNWVWLAIYLLLVSGFYMIYQFGGLFHAPGYVQRMMVMGLTMLGIYIYVFFWQYVPFSLRVAKQDWPKAGEILATIRKLVALNLTLGMLT